MFTVASNFLALIQQQEQLRVQRENLAADSALEQQIQTYVNAGARTIADLYQQQANVASARSPWWRRSAPRSWRAWISWRRCSSTRAASMSSSARRTRSSLQPQTLPRSMTCSRARSQQRTDIDAEEARVDAAEQNIRVARAGHWPDVSLSAGYSSGYTSVSPFSFSDQLDQRRGGSVGLNVSVPLFDRGAPRQCHATRGAADAKRAPRAREPAAGCRPAGAPRAAGLPRRAGTARSAAEAQLRAAELALQTSQERYQRRRRDAGRAVAGARHAGAGGERSRERRATTCCSSARSSTTTWASSIPARYLRALEPDALSRQAPSASSTRCSAVSVFAFTLCHAHSPRAP